jgi:hypothetical protein
LAAFCRAEVTALDVLQHAARRDARGLAVQGDPQLAVPDAQSPDAQEICFGERRQVLGWRTDAGLLEDLRAPPEVADSNLVWGRLCPEPPGAQPRLALLSQPPEKPQAALLQEKALTLPASLKRALAALPALVVPPESPGAAQRVS